MISVYLLLDSLSFSLLLSPSFSFSIPLYPSLSLSIPLYPLYLLYPFLSLPIIFVITVW